MEPSNVFKINSQQFAEVAGLKNAKTASTVWAQIKRKLFGGQPSPAKRNTNGGGKAGPEKATGTANGTSSGDDEETPSKPASKKRSRSTDDPDATPTKRAKKAAASCIPKSFTSEDDEDQEIVKKEGGFDEEDGDSITA